MHVPNQIFLYGGARTRAAHARDLGTEPGRPLDLTFSLCVDLGSKRAIAGGDEYVVRAGREHGSRELVGHSVLLNHRGF
jgi:hypothetical protein